MHSITLALATCVLLLQLITVCYGGQKNPPKDDTIYGGESNQAEEPKLDYSEILRKFAIKFYKGRFMEGQNLVVAPLLIFNAFMSLYNIADASTRFDIHSMVDIPDWAREEQMWQLEKLSDSYLRPANTSHSHLSARLYYDKSIGKITRRLKGENLTTVESSFADKSTFLGHVNGWVRQEYPRSTDDLVRDYDVDGETKVFMAGAFSFAWPTSHLTPSATEGAFQGEKVTFLEGSVPSAKYARIDKLQIEVVELTRDEMGEIKLWLILPGQGATIKQFNEKLNVGVISEVEKSLQDITVSLSVPEVSIENNSQEDAYVMEVFDIFTSLFTTPSVQLADGKDNFYPIKRFMMKSIFRLAKGDGTAQTSASQPTVKFDRPFAMMILTKDGNVPLMMANYFSPVDKIRDLERKYRLLVEKEKHDL